MDGHSASFFLLISALFCGGSLTSGEVITDLTHDLRPGIPLFPGIVPFNLTTHFLQENGITYKSDNFSTETHIGTHIDAPSHFTNGTWNITQIPLHRLIAPAVLIDIRWKALVDPCAQLTVDDLTRWTMAYGKIPDGSVILLQTGWEKHWSDPQKYLGYRADGSRSVPGVSGSAASWIVQNTKAYGVGIDTISIDSGDDVIAHLILTRNSLYIIENLKNLHTVPPKGATLYVMPIKIENASGAPGRVIAIRR